MSDNEKLERLQMLIAVADGLIEVHEATGCINEQAALTVAALIGREIAEEDE